ncbi:sterol O-acyltransferase 2-like isoform X3 [Crotalus tigris]|uniref:sterol O-acyltransferase 2-like isoform X3 n=1 Tax=Crotalus tigris TaxID=88082 RepID=UPI00192F272A|nr:sterol O-acyltransferase 2-like isoform X3 [Crotalus tigris]
MEMNTGGMRQRSSREQTRGEEETQLLNGEDEHLENVIAHSQWKRHLEVMKVNVLEQVHNQLSDLLDKTLEEAAHSIPWHLRVAPAKKQSREKGQLLKKKVFVPQQSLYDLVLDFDLIISSFRQLPTALFAWLCMFLYTLCVPYQALQIWSGCLKMTRFPNLLTVTLVVLVLLCHTAMLGFFPLYILLSCDLGIASRFIVLSEQIRFLMKSHSFLRESMPPLLHARDQVGKISPPELSTYLYFLFCPTLIYRKSYPRDPYIRWSYVIQKLVEFLASIYFVNFLMKYSFIPMSKNMHKQPFTIKILLLSIFDSVVPGITLGIMMHYFFLHCWQNMFAEILRFADRSFYKDWWNSRSFSGFFRTLNVIVHDWLYYYIYQDILRLFGGRARGGAMLIVFLLSAVVHEYLFTLAFSMFFPVMFVLFATIGVLLNFVLNDKRKNPVWNIIIWIGLILGTTTFFSLYSQEWFARAHCPLKEKTFWQLVTPRSWSCHQ